MAVTVYENDSRLNWINAGWVTATAYTVHDALLHNGASYRCILAHTSGATSEPGVGGTWTTYWKAVAEKGATGAAGAISLVRDEGVDMAVRGKLNFIGAGVTLTDDAGNDETEITIPGGGSSSLITDVCLCMATTGVISTNAPAAATEFHGSIRARIDLTGYTQARVTLVNQAAGATSSLRLQYALSPFSSWAYLDGTSGPTVVVPTSANSSAMSAWVNLEAAAKADVLLRAVTFGGNGTEDPSFHKIHAQFK